MLDAPFFIGVLIAVWPVNMIRSQRDAPWTEDNNVFHTEAGRTCFRIQHGLWNVNMPRHAWLKKCQELADPVPGLHTVHRCGIGDWPADPPGGYPFGLREVAQDGFRWAQAQIVNSGGLGGSGASVFKWTRGKKKYHTYVRTYIHMYVRTYIHTCIHAYMHTCIHAYMHRYIDT